jgi:hypothetical protein
MFDAPSVGPTSSPPQEFSLSQAPLLNRVHPISRSIGLAGGIVDSPHFD